MSRRFGFNPDWVVHPGETLREWREENHLPASAAAMACARMPLPLYEGIEAGTQPIDDTVASALAHGTHIPATLWLNLERIFRAGLAAGKTWTPPMTGKRLSQHALRELGIAEDQIEADRSAAEAPAETAGPRTPATKNGVTLVVRSSAGLTDAGRRLLAFYDDSYNPEWDTFAEAVVAIEHEAITLALTELRREVREMGRHSAKGHGGCLPYVALIDLMR